VPAFVGRTEPLARLTAAYRAIAVPPSGNPLGWAHLVLVTGEAGIGKTALLTRFASQIAADGATVVWGTCWDGDQAPAWWPWTQALRALLDRNHDLVDSATPELPARTGHHCTRDRPTLKRHRCCGPGTGIRRRRAVPRPRRGPATGGRGPR
jgi:hypothetical protein